MTKICTKCEVPKPLDDFPRSPKSRSGVGSRCKQCNAEYARIRYRNDAEHRENVKANTRKYYLENSEKVKLLARQRMQRPGMKESARAYFAGYYLRNGEEIRARTGAYKRGNPEKPRIHDHRRRARMKFAAVNDFTDDQWAELLEEFDDSCAYCHKRGVPLQVEHMTPVSKGGTNTKSNIVPACQSCNGRKGVKNIFEFAGHQSRMFHEWYPPFGNGEFDV